MPRDPVRCYRREYAQDVEWENVAPAARASAYKADDQLEGSKGAKLECVMAQVQGAWPQVQGAWPQVQGAWPQVKRSCMKNCAHLRVHLN